MTNLDPVHYSHHYINPAAPKAVVSPTIYKDEHDIFIKNQRQTDKKVREYFEFDISPKARNAYYKMENMLDYAFDLNLSAEDDDFKTRSDADGKTTYEYEQKRKGLKKYNVIRVYEGGTLKTKVELIPDKIAVIKDYKDSINNYDYYEIHLPFGERIFKENVKEKSDGFSLRTSADRVYKYKRSFLKSYEEGVVTSEIGRTRITDVKKRFLPNYDDNTVEYFENITKDSSPFKSEQFEFSTVTSFKRFLEKQSETF